jgi:hypothetical protein
MMNSVARNSYVHLGSAGEPELELIDVFVPKVYKRGKDFYLSLGISKKIRIYPVSHFILPHMCRRVYLSTEQRQFSSSSKLRTSHIVTISTIFIA